MSCAPLSSSLQDLIIAVDALKKYGMNVRTLLALGTPLFETFQTHAPHDALALYSLASHHDLYDLAAYASSHLLSLDIRSLPDEIIDQIDAVYLKHLFLLHTDRVAMFKRLLVPPPHHHPPTVTCSAVQQNDTLNRNWALVTCYLSFGAQPDMSEETIKAAFSGVAPSLPCALCRRALADRLQKVIDDWSAVKVRAQLIPLVYMSECVSVCRSSSLYRQPCKLPCSG